MTTLYNSTLTPDRPQAPVRTGAPVLDRADHDDPCPIMGLGRDFPDLLWVLSHPSSGRYGCFCHEGTHGLAVFNEETSAIRFAEMIDLVGMLAKEEEFDAAREIAKGRPMPVVAMLLLDDINDPKIHYVK